MHQNSLKFHAIYSITLSIVFLLVTLFVRDILLGAAMAFLLLYVVGNGIIHTNKNELTQDTLLEYVLVAIIVLVVIISAIN